VTKAAAQSLGLIGTGVASVRLTVVGGKGSLPGAADQLDGATIDRESAGFFEAMRVGLRFVYFAIANKLSPNTGDIAAVEDVLLRVASAALGVEELADVSLQGKAAVRRGQAHCLGHERVGAGDIDAAVASLRAAWRASVNLNVRFVMDPAKAMTPLRCRRHQVRMECIRRFRQAARRDAPQHLCSPAPTRSWPRQCA